MTGDTLAIDLGGTKILVGLVRDGVCRERRRIATTGTQPAAWLDAVAAATADWRGGYAQAGVAVTGRVEDERWWSLNPAVLPVPPGFPLIAALRERLGVPVVAANDAQAAAWGEYRHGAGDGRDLAFVTLSTGIGAGLVLGGRLLTGSRGLAGHLGQFRETADGPWLEHVASGSALAQQAAALGHACNAIGVFAASAAGAAWASDLVDRALQRIAGALASLQALADPDCIVIGGGIGLAPEVIARLDRLLAPLDVGRPVLRRADLGDAAGLLGIADLASAHLTERIVA